MVTGPFCAECGTKAVLKAGETCNDCKDAKVEARIRADLANRTTRAAEKQSARNRKDFRKDPGKGKKK